MFTSSPALTVFFVCVFCCCCCCVSVAFFSLVSSAFWRINMYIYRFGCQTGVFLLQHCFMSQLTGSFSKCRWKRKSTLEKTSLILRPCICRRHCFRLTIHRRCRSMSEQIQRVRWFTGTVALQVSNLQIDGYTVEQVNFFVYLGFTVIVCNCRQWSWN